MLRRLTGRPVLGVLPWRDGLWLDVEDSLDLDHRSVAGAAACGGDVLRVAVVRLPRISNFTDVDALAAEPGVVVRLVDPPAELADADLVVLPGSRGDRRDLAWLRERGLDRALRERAAAGRPMLGICGGLQMLGTRIVDGIESGAGPVAGLGLLPLTTRFAPEKVLAAAPAVARARGHRLRDPPRPGDCRARRAVPRRLRAPARSGAPPGTAPSRTTGSAGHSSEVAAEAGRRFLPGDTAFAAVRERQLDVLGDPVADHLDTAALCG